MSDASRRAQIRVRRLAAVLVFAACGGDVEPAPAVLHLGEDTVVLAPGARITDIHVRAGSVESEFLPAEVEARPGDVLRFSAEDGGPHALVFSEGDTDAAGFEFVTRTDQQRGLPLTEQGAAWVVTFADAPPGRYTVHCLTHGASLPVTVTAPATH